MVENSAGTMPPDFNKMLQEAKDQVTHLRSSWSTDTETTKEQSVQKYPGLTEAQRLALCRGIFEEALLRGRRLIGRNHLEWWECVN